MLILVACLVNSLCGRIEKLIFVFKIVVLVKMNVVLVVFLLYFLGEIL